RPGDAVAQSPGPAAGAISEEIACEREGLAWLTTELPVLLAALPLAATVGFYVHTWQLAWALDTFLWRRGPSARPGRPPWPPPTSYPPTSPLVRGRAPAGGVRSRGQTVFV